MTILFIVVIFTVFIILYVTYIKLHISRPRIIANNPFFVEGIVQEESWLEKGIEWDLPKL